MAENCHPSIWGWESLLELVAASWGKMQSFASAETRRKPPKIGIKSCNKCSKLPTSWARCNAISGNKTSSYPLVALRGFGLKFFKLR